MKLSFRRRAAAKPGATARKPRPPGRRKRQGRGILLVIAGLLAGSGLLRIGDDAIALAQAPATASSETATVPVSCPVDAGNQALLDALRNRSQQLDQREAALADRSKAIELASVQIDSKMQALVAAEQKLASTLAMADKAADTDVQRLTAMYENMKPKEAAPLFSKMDPAFAAGFLSRMQPQAAGAVLAALEPQTAYAISVILAGRNAAAPKQ